MDKRNGQDMLSPHDTYLPPYSTQAPRDALWAEKGGDSVVGIVVGRVCLVDSLSPTVGPLFTLC
jgi:hypothetical protein